ncbi:hypothetical protein BJ944DRAFT_113340 [Cunninghamella echinulata]|nr:hypothetical protein BJ944DRAFT_113340 [Cunninghamella echinulata]
MDDIVSATPPTFTEQKKRNSDESERSLSNVPTAFTKINTSLKKMNNNNLTIETSNNSHKNNSTTTSSSHHHITSPTHISVQTSATEQPKRLGHKRTASTQPGLTMHINNNHNKSTKLQGRRGSLPPLLKIPTQQQSNNSNTNSNNNKLNNVDFSPVSRSPFTSNLPPLPEKGSISINIHHPTKNDLGKHLIQPQHENMIKNISYILLWYFFSTSLSLYNKNLMGRDRFNFQFPLLVSAVHSAIHAVIAFLMLSFGGDRWQSKPSSINQESNQASLSTFNYIYKVVCNACFLNMVIMLI